MNDQMGPGLVDDRYRLLCEIGRGGMGVVYLAMDTSLERRVALKIIAPELVSHAVAVESFQAEARALARVRNMHVVQVHAFGRDNDKLYFAMEYVRGKTLGEIIQDHNDSGGLVPRKMALRVLTQLAEGLDAVHAANTFHRDVKPDNVIVEDGIGRPVLIDFGLAVYGARASHPPMGFTPEYAAPEQVRGDEKADGRADLYSFAAMAFELLSGHLPFEAGSSGAYLTKHAFNRPRRMSTIREELAALDDVFDRALAKDPEHRFESCGTLMAAIASRLDPSDASWSVPPRASDPGAPRFNVLIASSDRQLTSLVSRALTITFHGVPCCIGTASTVDDFVDECAKTSPKLVVLDPDSVGRDVIDAYAQARLVLEERIDCVAMVSDPEQDQRRLRALGIEPAIVKPVTLPGLLTTLQHVAVAFGWKRELVPHRPRVRRIAPDAIKRAAESSS